MVRRLRATPEVNVTEELITSLEEAVNLDSIHPSFKTRWHGRGVVETACAAGVEEQGNLDWLEAMTTHASLVAFPALFLLSLVPGPNNLLAASNGLRFGAGPAVLAVAGRIAAFVALIGLTLVGLGALLAASETAFALVKWGGVAYLAWLGIQTWRAPPLLAAAGPGTAGPSGLMRLAWQELLLAAGNPKAILIFTAVFPQLVDPSLPALPQLIAIGATFLATEWIVAALYALAGSRLGLLRSRARWARLPNRVFGSLFMAAAGLLATARRA